MSYSIRAACYKKNELNQQAWEKYNMAQCRSRVACLPLNQTRTGLFNPTNCQLCFGEL